MLQIGNIERTLLSNYSLQLGYVIELLLLSAALTYSVRRQSQRSRADHQQAIELAQRVQKLQSQGQLAEEHRQLQRSLQGAQRLKTIGQMSGGFAHEFNNILASMLGFAELARARISEADNPALTRYVSEIEQAGHRGSDLVKQLLIYSRGGQADPRIIDLSEVLGDIEQLLSATFPSSVEFNVEIKDTDLVTRIDLNQFKQILINLCLNASEAMNEKGIITVRLSRQTLSQNHCVSCLNQFQGKFAVIEVEDKGVGIKGNPEEIFTPFHTSKSVGQGTGLGLSVVHGITHENGGHLGISSPGNNGSRFSVYLPEQESVASIPHIHDKNILIIEDDSAVARFLKSLLEEQGYSVSVANVPTQALEQFMANPDVFDLVITDQLMPNLSGLELARDFRALRPELPIILCSADIDALDPDLVAAAGIYDTFAKPIEVESLLKVVDRLLSKREASSA